ncbi:MAG: DUF4251 domain-containing protein [Flavisolibacter sp.]|jgi:hypothetical protein|nr:DUF4251 domain-containing protein [Flavisolibacter sp.]
MKLLYGLCLLFIFGACSSSRVTDNTAVTQLLESGNYAFIAQTMSPSRATPTTIAGSGYGLRLTNDSLSVLLPFFGRAFDASVNRTGGPIEVNTRAFESNKTRKNKRWEISFSPAASTQVRQLFLSVSDNGYASLQVISTNRETVSFNGTVEALK